MENSIMLDFQIYDDKDKQVWFVLKKMNCWTYFVISARGSLGEDVGPVVVQF